MKSYRADVNTRTRKIQIPTDRLTVGGGTVGVENLKAGAGVFGYDDAGGVGGCKSLDAV